jgi:hypothetical protein
MPWREDDGRNPVHFTFPGESGAVDPLDEGEFFDLPA